MLLKVLLKEISIFKNGKDFYFVHFFFSKLGVIENHYSQIVLCKRHKSASTLKSSFQQETLFRGGHCFCSQIFVLKSQN